MELSELIINGTRIFVTAFDDIDSGPILRLSVVRRPKGNNSIAHVRESDGRITYLSARMTEDAQIAITEAAKLIAAGLINGVVIVPPPQ